MPYLTPNAPGSLVGRILYVPNTYLPSVNGALYELAQSWNWEQFGTETVDNAVDAMLAMWEDYSVSSLDAFDSVSSPIAIPLWHYDFAINPPTWASNINQNGGGYLTNTTAAINDQLDYKVWLSAAAWTLALNGELQSANGIITVKVDGTTKGTIDYYQNAAQFNVAKTLNLGTLSRGLHTITLKMASKNAGSTNYFYRISDMLLRLT